MKTTYENITGNLNLDEFLKQFFSNALIPIFQNRSKFIESGYLDNLTYDSDLINFFDLKEIQFQNLLIDNNNKPITKWNNLIKNILVISKGFYRDYIRAIFDERILKTFCSWIGIRQISSFAFWEATLKSVNNLSSVAKAPVI